MILTNRRKRKNISKGFHGKGGSRVLLLRMGRVDKGDREGFAQRSGAGGSWMQTVEGGHVGRRASVVRGGAELEVNFRKYIGLGSGARIP